MHYTVTCSSIILSLVIPPFFFIFVGIICEFAMVQVCTFYCPIRKKRFITLPKGTDKAVVRWGAKGAKAAFQILAKSCVFITALK